MYNVHIITHAWSIMLLLRANGVHESGPHHYITYTYIYIYTYIAYVSVGHYSQPKRAWLQNLIPLVQCYFAAVSYNFTFRQAESHYNN